MGKTIQCDLITTQDPFECGWVGTKLKREKGVPLEVQLHTNPFSKGFNGFLNFVRKQIMRGVLKKADSIRVVSESLIQKLAASNSQLEAKAVVLPIYIDRERIEGGPKFDLHEKHGFKKVLLAVSRLTEEKNIPLALDVLRKVRERHPDTGLVIVGSGPFESELKLKARSYNLGASVVFAGWQEDLVSYYKTADLFLQTSKFEGYGLSLVEAGLCGLPVVTTPVGIATELENVTIANTADEFARAIESAMMTPNKGLKQELETKILKKEEYLSQLKNNWQKLLQK